VSFFIENVSRALTAELNRHGDWTAVSQRSTRYCDEDKASIVPHPEFVRVSGSEEVIDDLYHGFYKKHKLLLLENGVNERQARGSAARELPLGLETQEIFSASLAQWKHILTMRLSEAADAEIRELAKEIDALLRAKFPTRF